MFSLLCCEAAPLQGRGGVELPTREFHLSLDLISPAVHVISSEHLARLHTGVGGGGCTKPSLSCGASVLCPQLHCPALPVLSRVQLS